MQYIAASPASDAVLSIGAYNFTVLNNAIISWTSAAGGSGVFKPPVPPPATWQTCYTDAVGNPRVLFPQCFSSGGQLGQKKTLDQVIVYGGPAAARGTIDPVVRPELGGMNPSTVSSFPQELAGIGGESASSAASVWGMK